jgi:hypothetical protein
MCVCVRARDTCVRVCVFPYFLVSYSPSYFTWVKTAHEIRKTLETHSLEQLQVSLPFVRACIVLHITVAKSEK